MAQLGARLNGIQKVVGSIPISSIFFVSEIYYMLNKRTKKFLSPVFLFPLLFFSIFHSSLISQQQTIDIDDLKKGVEEIGKLKFKTDIPIRYFSKARMQKYISTLVEEEYLDELAAKDALFIQLMGFSNRKLNLKKIRKKIFISNAGGLYNEKTGKLFVSNDYRTVNMMNAPIIVHELRHALQDAYFNLSEILGEYSDFDDRKLAVLSAIEGDATFVMVKYIDFDPEVMSSAYSSDALISFSPIGNTAQLSRAPGIVKHQLTMPHIKGLRFVSAVFKKKKWKGVNKILKSPPDSTEQILHPEKYLKREKPIPVIIDYKPGGYNLYHTGVIGEYYLNILLKPRDNYIDYAFGWGGDSFKIYKNVSSSSYFLVWKSVWDEEKFCSNFYFDFKRFIEKKFQVNFKKGNIKSSLFTAGRSDLPGSGYFFIRRIKNRMIYARSNDKNQMNLFIYGGNYD